MSASTPIETVRSRIAQHAVVLDRSRSAFDLPYLPPPEATSFNYDDQRVISDLRRVSRLFRGEARVAEAEGRHGDAAQRCLDCFELGADIGRDSVWLWGLNAAAHQAIGGTDLENRVIAQLSAADACGALERLNRIDAEWGAWADTLRAEQTAYEQMSDESLEEKWSELMSVDPSLLGEVDAWVRQWNSGSDFRVAIKAGKPEAFDSYIRDAAKPYSDRRMYPVPLTIKRRFLTAEAIRDLLRLMLALQAELMETGEFPASLSPLRGTLGGKLPTDPFSGKGYRYRRTETGYRLWSVGPDLRDNGGSVPVRSFDLSMGKPGDLVAGSMYGWPRGLSRRDPTQWPF